MWAKLLEFILGLFRRAPERIEPVIEGWGELTEDQRGFISVLKQELSDLRAELREIKEEVKECNKERAELLARVELLERRAREDYDYAHQNLHNVKDFLFALDEDLKANGIALEVRTEVLKQQESRRRKQ